LALTVFGNTNISQNKSILKAIKIVKANRKNKERSREKSLIKDRKQNNINVEKTGNVNVIKDRGVGIRPLEKKRVGKKNEINKSKSINNLERSKQSNLENINCDNNVNISEFSLENEQNEENNSLKQKNEYMNKITEVNIKLDKENIPKNNLKSKNILSNINASCLFTEIMNPKFDLQFAEEYQEEIIPYLLSLENKKRINPNYMSKQNDINEKMRMILIDWLIEVHLKFKLLPETLFLTINFIDRYLQNNQTPRDKLQLIAVSSLLIACKYEEIYPPEISSFVYITDNAYNKDDILNYEIKILGDLEYDLTYPTPLRFLEIVAIKLGFANDKVFLNKMMYLIELCLSKLFFYNYTYLELVLACCLFLYEKNYFFTQNIIRCFDLGDNCNKLEKIKSCVFEVKKLLEYMNENKNMFKGVRQKYATEKYGCISMNEFL
jgi:cyclin B